MNLFNFIVWLSTGAVIGWFASRMVKAEKNRQAHKAPPGENLSSKES